MHFIPTYTSWLNQVERFFALITVNAIRRGNRFLMHIQAHVLAKLVHDLPPCGSEPPV
jgi:hypothetical protein